VIDVTGTLRIPRSRGALSAGLLILFGIWGAVIPFIGPYFHYAFTPDKPWIYTSGRVWLDVLPGIGAVIGGVIVLVSTVRPVAVLGAWLAAASGAWFAVGTAVAPLWTTGHVPAQGTPTGSALTQAWEQIGFFTGLGAIVTLIASVALGRLSVHAARDAARTAAQTDQPVPDTQTVTVPRLKLDKPDEIDATKDRSPIPAGLRRAADWVRSS
jgi:hypothetical protein